MGFKGKVYCFDCVNTFVDLTPQLLDIIMEIADASASPSDTILNMSDDNKMIDFLMNEYNRRTKA